MSNSVYIQLSSSVLLEYTYNSKTVNTDDDGGWIQMLNGYENSSSFFNTNFGNSLTRSATIIDPTTQKYGYLEQNHITNLDDYDPNINIYPLNFAVNLPVVYDRVRIHLTQGFNFENNLGFYFNLSFKNKNGSIINHLNLAYQDSDDYAKINPEPFIYGGKYYSSYIEIFVYSLKSLVDEYWNAIFSQQPTSILPSERLTAAGPDRNALIESKFGWIVNESESNGQRYFNVYDFKRVDLPTSNNFDNLSVVIQDASDGDYIELYAAYDGQIIDNFIRDLNNAPDNDYLILHEINVYENIWNDGSNTTWVKTGGLEFVQDSNFEDPIPYRPIIQNSSAVAFRIDYSVRLYNREDNSSIWKTGSYQSNNAAKWSKSLKRIYLSKNPIQPKVYNKIVDKNVNFLGNSNTSIIQNSKNYVKYVTNFLTNNNIILSSENAFIQKNPTTGEVNITSTGNSESQTIYAQGLSKINLTNSDTFVKFVIYTGNPDASINLLDLTGLGDLYLNFFSNNGEIKRFKKLNSIDISESNGEILFKIPQKDSLSISKFENKSYTITSNTGDSESQLYIGTFVNIENQVESLKDLKINNLEKRVKELEELNKSLNELLSIEENTSRILESTNLEQGKKIQNLERVLDRKIEENDGLIKDDSITIKQKTALKQKIKDLNQIKNSLSLGSNQSNISSVDPNYPVQYIKPKSQNILSTKNSPYN